MTKKETTEKMLKMLGGLKYQDIIEILDWLRETVVEARFSPGGDEPAKEPSSAGKPDDFAASTEPKCSQACLDKFERFVQAERLLQELCRLYNESPTREQAPSHS